MNHITWQQSHSKKGESLEARVTRERHHLLSYDIIKNCRHFSYCALVCYKNELVSSYIFAASAFINVIMHCLFTEFLGTRNCNHNISTFLLTQQIFIDCLLFAGLCATISNGKWKRMLLSKCSGCGNAGVSVIRTRALSFTNIPFIPRDCKELVDNI